MTFFDVETYSDRIKSERESLASVSDIVNVGVRNRSVGWTLPAVTTSDTKTISDTIIDIIDELNALTEEQWKNLTNFGAAVSVAAQKWWDDATDAVIIFLRELTDTVREAITTTMDWYNGLDSISGINSDDDPAIKIIKGLAHETTQWFESLVAGIQNWWDNTDDEPIRTIRGISETIFSSFATTWVTLKTWYDTVASEISNFINDPAEYINNLVTEVIFNITDSFKDDRGVLGAFYEGLFGDTEDSDDTDHPVQSNTANDAAKAIGTGLRTTWVTLKTWYDTVSSEISNFINDPAGYINDLVTEVIFNITDSFKDDRGVLGAFYEGLFGDTEDSDDTDHPVQSNTANDAAKAIGTGLKTVWNTLYDLFFDPDYKFRINLNFLTAIGASLTSGATDLLTGINNALFGDTTPEAFADGRITNSINSNDDGSIGKSIADSVSEFAVDLGDISGNLSINLSEHSTRQLYGNINANSTITFTDITDDLFLSLRLFIRTANPTIIIGGNTVNTDFPAIGTLVEGDFLDIVLESTDQSTIVLKSVKKNDEEIEQIASSPDDLGLEPVSSSSVRVTWGLESGGVLPTSFIVELYTTNTENSDGEPTGTIISTATVIEKFRHTFTGLDENTTYYAWVKGRNSTGDSTYVGPQSTTTYLDTPTILDLSATVTPSYLSVSLSWDTQSGFNFVLVRILPDDSWLFLLGTPNDDGTYSGSSSTSFTDDEGILPESEYDYKIGQIDSHGRFLGFLNLNTVITLELSAPSLILSTTGTILSIQVTFPAYIESVELEDTPLGDDVDSDGRFSEHSALTTVQRLSTDPDISQSFTKTVDILNRNINSLYYVHGRSKTDISYSEWSDIISATTSSYLRPYGIRSSSDLDYEDSMLEISVRFRDDYRGEFVRVWRTLFNSDGATFPNNVRRDVEITNFNRRGDIRDTDSREDRVELTIPVVPPTSGYWRFFMQSFNESGEDFTGSRRS